MTKPKRDYMKWDNFQVLANEYYDILESHGTNLEMDNKGNKSDSRTTRQIEIANEITEKLYPRIQKDALKVLPENISLETFEDIVQETALQVIRKIKDYIPSNIRFAKFMTTGIDLELRKNYVRSTSIGMDVTLGQKVHVIIRHNKEKSEAVDKIVDLLYDETSLDRYEMPVPNAAKVMYHSLNEDTLPYKKRRDKREVNIDPTEGIYENQRREGIELAFETLDKRTCDIAKKHYIEGKNKSEIAEEYGKTREWGRQNVNKAIKQVKELEFLKWYY